MKAKERFDHMLYGLIPGIVLPVISLLGFWMVRSDEGFFDFLAHSQQFEMLPKLLSLCAIPNLLLFFVFIWTNRIFSARGVILATLIVGFVMLILKFA